MPISLQEHILRSRQAVEANKAKGNRHAEILTRMYTDPHRFLEEIIQNTEDAYSKKSDKHHGRLLFCLNSDHLDILHNGQDFDEEDLKAITTFAGTTKIGLQEVNLIGKFGIGFRAVYGITAQPEIHCEPWHFRIDDHEVLEQIEPVNLPEEFNTLIRLPFKQGEEKKQHAVVQRGLESLDPHCLLFLKQIREIEIRTGRRQSGLLRCEYKPLNAYWGQKQLFNSRHGKDYQKYLTLTGEYRKKHSFSFCFLLEEDQTGSLRVQRMDSAGLYVYFATQTKPYPGFLLHGDFTTNPTREYIPFNKTSAPENIGLLEYAVDFLCKHLRELKKMGLISPSLIEALIPETLHKTDTEYHLVRFRENMILTLTHRNIIPTADHNCASGENLVWSADNEIIELADKKDPRFFFQRKSWLCREFSLYPQTLSVLLLECKVKEVDIKSFAFRVSINPQILQTKSKKWFLKLYELLCRYPEIIDESHIQDYFSLRQKPIIRMADGSLSPAYDQNGNPIVQIPTGKRATKGSVARDLISNDDSLRFLKMLGIHETDHAVNKTEGKPIDLKVISQLASAALLGYNGNDKELLLEWGRQFCGNYCASKFENYNSQSIIFAVRNDISDKYLIELSKLEILVSAAKKIKLLLLTKDGISGPQVTEVENPQQILKERRMIFDPVSFIFPEE